MRSNPVFASLVPSESEKLGLEVCQRSVLLHAAMADLALAAASFDTTEAWAGDGISSCAQWLSLNAGFSTHSGAELIRVGHALEDLPQTSNAFKAGTLSYDKVLAITSVATPGDEDVWVELAVQASGSQLARICRQYRRAIELNDPLFKQKHLRRRGLWWQWDEDDMLRFTALLPPDEGALLIAAVQTVIDDRSATPPSVMGEGESADALLDPADDYRAARRMDALVAICQQGMSVANADEPALAGLPATMVVHVDIGVLTGMASDGRCGVDNGPVLSASVMQRIGCDAEVYAITERDGLPIDVGRTRRVVSTALRRALHARDQGCRFPGCGVPVRRTHAHHIQHWAHGGRTDLANLVSLCNFHHRRLHDGAFCIRPEAEGTARFETTDGRLIAPTVISFEDANSLRTNFGLGWGGGPGEVNPETARAQDGGQFDMNHTVWVITSACQRRKPPPAPTG